jgi:hypothetical protein
MRYFPLFLLTVAYAFADGANDNKIDEVRPIPPAGVPVPNEVREKLESSLAGLKARLQPIQADPLLPDVEIFHKAVDWSLRYGEFFDTKEFKVAERLLAEGNKRAALLAKGEHPWTTATGFVVRGYRSKIDGSAQPYGLIVPESVKTAPDRKRRLDFWFHGRGETVTELNFIQQRMTTSGQFVPEETLVLHPFGRYCNANKLAGEVDLFEALEHAKSQYAVDEDRLVVRGFSMGGAACWQFAVHYAGLWAAAQPGAGFAETPEFLKFFQNEDVQPTPYERKLWHLYDCVDWAGNLRACPTVAYSGEIDKQKQAADIMETALKAEGLALTHIVGKGMAHKIDDASALEISRRIDSIADKGRDVAPLELDFTTWTLRYNTMKWLTIDGMSEHWSKSQVKANIQDDGILKVNTENVTGLTFKIPSGYVHRSIRTVQIDGVSMETPLPSTDRSFTLSLCKKNGTWTVGTLEGLRKKHGLQGPIDDAFMDSFIFVEPSGPAGDWVSGELAHAKTHWRQHFRGDAVVKKDTEITDADIANSNLILWGDAASNAIIARIADKLPNLGHEPGQAVVMIYPNPLNPEKYVVLNSGFTWREYDYLNNARQVPKLPDWAIIDVTQPVTSRHPGGVVRAGFFDESWKLAK